MLLKTLKKHGQLIFILKLILCLSILYFTVMFTLSTKMPYCVITQFILGALYTHMKELQHEALHGVIQRKWINRFFGFLLGIPMLVSYSDYKYNHMLHHRYIGTNKDTEFFTYSESKDLSFYNFILSLFMFEHYIHIVKKVFKLIFFNQAEMKQSNVQQQVKQEYIILISIIIVTVSLSIIYKSLIIFKLWVIPLILFTAPINFLIELPEHALCKKNSLKVFYNTRTIKSNWLMNWFVNGNNFHVEHHYAPHYPIYALSRLHTEIRDKIIYFEKSYLDFYIAFFKALKKSRILK